MIDAGLNEPAARTAYLGALHAAQAFIFENTDKIVSSHKGAQSEFGRLTKDEQRVDGELRSFLPRAYSFKRIAGYETGPGSHISADTARAVIATADRFVSCVAGLMAQNTHVRDASHNPDTT